MPPAKLSVWGVVCFFWGFRADGVNGPEYLLAISSAIPQGSMI